MFRLEGKVALVTGAASGLGAGISIALAPIQYLFGGFETLALEKQPGLFACYFPMPFLKQARIQLRNPTQSELAVRVRYGVDRDTPVPAIPYYFHAQFREINPSVGYQDFVVLATKGGGH